MAQGLPKNVIASLAIMVGILGGLIVGATLAFLFQEKDDFTDSQRLYISGVSVGSGFLQTKLDIEKQSVPTAGEESLLRRPEDRCIREYYPNQPIPLAGCLEAVGKKIWDMPN